MRENNRKARHMKSIFAVLGVMLLLSFSTDKAYAVVAPTGGVDAATDAQATTDATETTVTTGTATTAGAAATADATTTNTTTANDAATTNTTSTTVSDQTVSGTNAASTESANTVSTDTATVPAIYAVRSVAGAVTIGFDEAADESSVSEHLEENLTATVDAATGTTLTTEEWANAIATVDWQAAPVGYDETATEDYSFTWSGVIHAGTVVYADSTLAKAASVAQDIPVTVTYNVSKSATVSESRAPQTGDAFKPGIWFYLLIVGAVVSLCSLILFRDKSI